MKRVHLGGAVPLRFIDDRSLAAYLQVTRAQLDRLSAERETHYKFELARDGSRGLDKPQPPLKPVLARLRALLETLPISDIAYGGVGGRSHLDCADALAGMPFIACVDIARFFPSVREWHVRELLRVAGCPESGMPLLARLLTVLSPWGRGGVCLPTGSPASPTFANRLLYGLDEHLAELSEVRRVVTFRVMDDYYFGGRDHDAVAELMGEAIKGIRSLGLRINHKKSRFMPRNRCQSVTRLNVNSGHPTLPRTAGNGAKATRAEIADELHVAIVEDRVDELRKRLEGRIRYLETFHPWEGARMRMLLQPSGDPRAGKRWLRRASRRWRGRIAPVGAYGRQGCH